MSIAVLSSPNDYSLFSGRASINAIDINETNIVSMALYTDGTISADSTSGNPVTVTFTWANNGFVTIFYGGTTGTFSSNGAAKVGPRQVGTSDVLTLGIPAPRGANGVQYSSPVPIVLNGVPSFADLILQKVNDTQVKFFFRPFGASGATFPTQPMGLTAFTFTYPTQDS